MQLSRSLILEVHLVPDGRAIRFGTLRHFAAMQQFSRFLSEADIQRAAIAEPDL